MGTVARLHRPAANSLVIRRARPEEAALLTDLSVRSKAVWGYDAAFLKLCREAMTLRPETIEQRPNFVAERDGRVLGFYGFEPLPEGVGLDFMFVEPDAIGQGVGRALWRHAVATARALGHAVLIVVADPNAAGFYRRMGAVPAGEQPSDLEAGRMLPVLRFPLGAAT
jgi:predicted N-acetyltransferase YhbS